MAWLCFPIMRSMRPSTLLEMRWRHSGLSARLSGFAGIAGTLNGHDSLGWSDRIVRTGMHMPLFFLRNVYIYIQRSLLCNNVFALAAPAYGSGIFLPTSIGWPYSIMWIAMISLPTPALVAVNFSISSNFDEKTQRPSNSGCTSYFRIGRHKWRLYIFESPLLFFVLRYDSIKFFQKNLNTKFFSVFLSFVNFLSDSSTIFIATVDLVNCLLYI